MSDERKYTRERIELAVHRLRGSAAYLDTLDVKYRASYDCIADSILAADVLEQVAGAETVTMWCKQHSVEITPDLCIGGLDCPGPHVALIVRLGGE